MIYLASNEVLDVEKRTNGSNCRQMYLHNGKRRKAWGSLELTKRRSPLEILNSCPLTEAKNVPSRT